MSAVIDAAVEVSDESPSDPGGPEVEHEERHRSRREARIVVGLTLLTVGLCLALFVAYLFGFTTLQQQRKQRQLLNIFTTSTGAKIYSGETPAIGDPVAVLRIPALNLHQVVVEGTGPQQLEAGPGSLPHAAALGTKGNAVILGRRFTAGAPFGKLASLRLGDRIVVTTGLGAFRYVVEGPARVAMPGETNPASPSKLSELTMITSESLSGSQKIFVRARLVSAPGASPRAKAPPTRQQLGEAGESSQVLATILWGCGLLIALAACITSYLRSRHHLIVVYVLSTPIVLAVALMFYAHLYQLMPSTT